MTVFIVIIWSVIGSVAGMVLLGELGPLFGIRDMEGQSAMFGLFTGAPLGLLCGASFGYWKASSYGEDVARRRKFIQLSLGGIVALVAAGFIFEMIRANDYIDTKYQSSRTISAQIRLPAGIAAPDSSKKITLELRSPKETRKSSPYSTPDWKLTDGRMQAYASVEAYRATPDRTLAVTIGDGPTHLFKMKAPARMKTYSYEGDWQKPDAVEGGTDAGLEMKASM